MNERYIRNIGALSESDCVCLRGKRVFVAGLGGLGGHIVDMLLRVGVGHICAADGDKFELSNLNRQLLCDMDAIGSSKAEAAEVYASKVNPDMRFTAFNGFITKNNVSALIDGCDAVLDALDSIPARRLLKHECDRQGIPYVFGGINAWCAQAAVSLPGDGLIDKLYPADAALTGESSLPFTAALCAALQCSLCVRLLCSKSVDCGRLYCFDLSEPELEKLLI